MINNKLQKFFIFILLIIFANIVNLLSIHYYFYFYDKNFYKMMIKIFIIALLFGTSVYLLKLFSFYNFIEKISLIEIELLYSFILILSSLIYVKYYIKVEIPTYSFIILMLILFLIILNFFIRFYIEDSK